MAHRSPYLVLPLCLVLAAACCSSTTAAGRSGRGDTPKVNKIQHVILLSVDGLHASDLDWIVKDNPHGAFADMAKHGVKYTNAYIQSNSDSFPGVLALTTGANPKTTGVYYDDSYDRSLWAPGTNCTNGKPDGPPGAEMVYDETVDKDTNDIQGGADSSPKSLDPKNLPLDASCKPVYPHQFVRANTIFEVAKSSGLMTAWTDKHPAYDLLNGPSGKGIDELYTPEINSGNIGFDFTNPPSSTPIYDRMHVTALVNWIHGRFWNGTARPGGQVPHLMGGNFQSVSTAEKVKGAGYLADGVIPSPQLAANLRFIDSSLGEILTALEETGKLSSTAIIVTAKHGQSPKKPSLLRHIPNKGKGSIPDLLASNNVKVAQATLDDVALIWLEDSKQTAAAAKLLTDNAQPLGIKTVYSGASLLALGWAGNPATDSRAPDIIVEVQPGVIYTGGSKIGEHGGLGEDDRHVGLLVYKQDGKAKVVEEKVFTVQVAPTVLQLLGVSPKGLDGVKKEGTKALPVTP